MRNAALRRLVTAIGVMAAIAAVLTLGGEERTGTQTPLRSVADLTQFDPGMIISDDVFFLGRGMSAAEVDAFIADRNRSCVTGTDGTPCLKDFRQTTTARSADAYCSGYTPGADETAGTIIAKVAVSCDINPKVLLVMLQKEQALMSRSGGTLTASRYQKAMGFACPDTPAGCDAAYYGFQNQVYSAARQFQKYAANPDDYTYRAGRTVNVLWNVVETGCGSAPVAIRNQATAGLYIYTPYQPNAAALRAGYGSGDACSAYGNRNFWLYFTDWFGSTVSDAIASASPHGVIDTASLTPSGFTATGWVFDPDAGQSPVTVRAYVDGQLVRSGTTGVPRPDVATAFGVGPNQGYSISGDLSYGEHQLCIAADNVAGLGVQRQLSCRSLTFTNVRPTYSLDVLQEQADGTVQIGGWAFDADGAAPQIHVYDNGVGRAYATTVPRPDVQAAMPAAGPTSGFGITVGPLTGDHNICVFVVDSVAPGNNQLVTCKKVTYQAPFGSVDSVTETVTGGLRIYGWALDRSTPTQSIPVHVYIDGRGTAFAASASRPDVGTVFPGVGSSHGIDVEMPVDPGKHEVCVFAINTGVLGANTLIRCVSVDLHYKAPVANVDRIAVTAPGQVAVEGWAYDPSVLTAPTVMHYWVDGVPAAQGIADKPRPDVDRVFGVGASHGFADTVSVPAGPHQVCVFALNNGVAGPNVLMRCQNVVG